MSFKEEMDKRLRRLCGVTDDSLDVVMNTATETITEWAGYSCEFTETNSWTVVKIINDTPFEGRESYAAKQKRITVAEKKFKDLGELMRALDEVEL